MATKQKLSTEERRAKLQKVYDTLKKVRTSKTVTLKPSPLLKTEYEDLNGTPAPFSLRYYQVQGAYHMIVLKRMILGDDVGLGKTIQTLAALCHFFSREPNVKVVVVSPKSTVHQWSAEVLRFTEGVTPYVVETRAKTKDGASPLEQRKAIYQRWLEHEGPSVLIVNYALLIRDWNAEGFRPVDARGKPDPKKPVVPGVLDQTMQEAAKSTLITVLDEAQSFKNMRTKTWEAVRNLSDLSDRVYGLTATLLKSHLMEGYCIFKAIKPELFGTKTNFMKAYCLTVLQAIPGSKQKIPVVQGYKNLGHFRKRIDPFFYGRFKKDVTDELPTLVAKDIICELSHAENKKYSEALRGVLELGDGVLKDYEDHRALVALIYCQQVVDSLALLKFEEGQVVDEGFDLETFDVKSIKVGQLGSKEQALVDLLGDELDGEKVIIYTRFASLVPRLQKVLHKQKIKSVCITGGDTLNAHGLDLAGFKSKASDSRKRAQQVFQDRGSGVNVIIITEAGGVGINLQMARAFIFYDMPWTWGDYVQILGRMIRIGSPHKGVIAYHLIAERPHDEGSRKTIDHHVLKLLRKKKKFIDQVLGEGLEGGLEFDKDVSLKSLVQALQEDT